MYLWLSYYFKVADEVKNGKSELANIEKQRDDVLSELEKVKQEQDDIEKKCSKLCELKDNVMYLFQLLLYYEVYKKVYIYYIMKSEMIFTSKNLYVFIYYYKFTGLYLYYKTRITYRYIK